MTSPRRPDATPRVDPSTDRQRPHAPRGRPAPGFFDDAYHRLIAPFHDESATRREVAAVREMIGLAQDDLVLDLGCGWGRHLVPLAEAGHRVVGLDLSHALLRRAARTRTRARARARELVAGEMRRLPFQDGSFDVVMNLATSLGLFLVDIDAVAALAEAGRVLRPGGRLLIEGMHRDDVVSNYAERDGWTMTDGTEVRVRRRFDAVRGVSHEVLRWSGPDGGGIKRHSLRLRSGTELVRLLGSAGLVPLAVYGGWEQERFGRDSERVILIARPRAASRRSG
jgi:protein-L-isoaspartate O-methyltransferase